MTSNTRSPEEIEREIEDQRSNLTENLESLQDKFSLDTVVRQFGDQFRAHGGDMGRTIVEQARANPVSLAITGIGLAWLMFGSSKNSASKEQRPYSWSEQNHRGLHAEQGRPYAEPNYSGSRGHDAPSWSQADDDDDKGVGQQLTDGADAVRSSAAQGVAATRSAVADAAPSVTELGSNMATQVKEQLRTASGRIAEGTEHLTEEGRRRVIAARQKALAMRRKALNSTQNGADAVSDFYDQQPLVMGALALAVGAAIGGALPRTRTEDDLMGAQSDHLYDEAEKIFEEEKSKALSVAKSVKDEVKDIAAETKADLDGGAPGDKSAVEAIGDKAKSVAGRVADKAKTTAEEKKLGKPKI